MPFSRLIRLYSACFLLTALAAASAFAQPTVATTTGVELKDLGTTYTRAQSADWLNPKRFAVGRWDGTISIFRPKSTVDEFGPVLVDVVTPPAQKGVELVADVDDRLFISSNDESSLILWRYDRNAYRCKCLLFDSKFGTAVSAAAVKTSAGRCVVVGHANGYLSFWTAKGESLALERGVSIRSPNPIKWEYQTWHIRGVADCGDGRVVTASEDGDLCLVSVSTGKVIYRQRYNPEAQRGMNDVDVEGNLVAAVNCSVGAQDKNFWLFEIVGDSLRPLASTNLIKDSSRPQVFAFAVELASYQDANHFLVSTEEGLLWLGNVDADSISITSDRKVSAEGGAALAVEANPLTILAAADQVQLFTLGPKTAPLADPETTSP